MTLAIRTSTDLATLEALADQTRSYIAGSRSRNTERSYSQGWTHFTVWAGGHGLQSLPATAETVALYITDLANSAKPSTIDSRLASINAAHRAAQLESPTKAEIVRLTRKGIRKTLTTSQRQAKALSVADIRAMVAPLTDSAIDTRDRALILIGFAGALRRSELVGLNVEDISETSDGLTITIRRSKTDQEGNGRQVGIPYGSTLATCPVRAWKAWFEVSQITNGAAFLSINRHTHAGARLSDRAVSLLLKGRATKVGLDSETISGHSLRAGLATSAAKAGVSERAIANQTGHQGVAMLRRYIRTGSLFNENAAACIGL